MPGTEVAFEREIERLSPFWMRPKKLGPRVARFRRVNPNCPTMHHDALELPSGEIVLLTRLREVQFASVISCRQQNISMLRQNGRQLNSLLRF
jgi:hypothetical protein